MDNKRFYTIFEEVFKKNDLEEYVEENIMRQFFRLTELMLETNAHMNITALTTIEKIIPLHYADCVKASAWIGSGDTVLDVGCGGGFPILPLAIVRPDLHLVGLDSTDKKVRYVQATAAALGLRIDTISGRAEDIAKLPEHREHYDLVVSRAVARLNVLNELCIPFVKNDGCFLAMKGAAGSEELEEAANGITLLGCSVESSSAYALHTVEGTESRVAVITRKVKPTPNVYPRSFGAIKKKPL